MAKDNNGFLVCYSVKYSTSGELHVRNFETRDYAEMIYAQSVAHLETMEHKPKHFKLQLREIRYGVKMGSILIKEVKQ